MTDINEEDLTIAYMLGRHDGRKDAERCQALSTVAGSQPSITVPAKWIVNHYDGHLDHACAQCVPHGEIIKEGFLCVYHQAVKALENTPDQARR